MENIKKLWLKFNESSNRLSEALGRSNNLVGEYAEHLAYEHYGGELLKTSSAGADIKSKDTHYQVKSRRIKENLKTQLSVIRSWDFDYLVVILFGTDGSIKKAMQVPSNVAKKHARKKEHVNGDVITTNEKFLSDPQSIDITKALQAINK